MRIRLKSMGIEINRNPHLLIALGRDLRIGNYVLKKELSMEKLEEELKFFQILINQKILLIMERN